MTTLQEELEAEFEKHDPEAAPQFLKYSCTCGWYGDSVAAHFAEVATRITNARIEGLIREAAEAGIKLREAIGTLEWGVAYTEKFGEKMTRVMAAPYAADNTKADAEEFLRFWHDKGNEAFLVTRQWRRAQ